MQLKIKKIIKIGGLILLFVSVFGLSFLFAKAGETVKKIRIAPVIEYLVESYSSLLSEDLEEGLKDPQSVDFKDIVSMAKNEITPWTQDQKYVYLTFDDGPNEPYTSQVLDILDKENVKVIFFVCGNNIERHPDTLKKTFNKGHLIGNHGYTHSEFVAFTGMGMEEETVKNNQLIKSIIGETNNFYRPPFGFLTPGVKKYLEQNNYKIVLPDIIAYDWIDSKTPEDIESAVVDKVKPGSIIVLHDGRGTEKGVNRSNMVAALPSIIQKLKKKGYTFKQVDQNTQTKFNLTRLQNLMIF